MHAFTGESRYHAFAQKTLEAFAGIAPQYGLFAATYGLAATLFAHHPLQVVITGRADDPAAQALEAAAQRVYRFGKSVLRLTPGVSLANLRGRAKADASASSSRKSRRLGLRRPNLPPAHQRPAAPYRAPRKRRVRRREFVT